jgi:hypothetical protein
MLVAVGASGIARYAVRHALVGRKIAGPDGDCVAMDADHPRAQEARGLRIVTDAAARRADASHGPGWQEWITGENASAPAEESIVGLDFGAWLIRLPARYRCMAEWLAEKHETGTVARALGISPAAVSRTLLWLADRECQSQS